MEYDIRQLSFGEVLDRSLRILIDNPVLLIGVAVFLGLPVAALQSGGKAFAVLSLIFALLATPLVIAALNSAIADTYLNRPVTIASAYRAAWSIILPFVGTYLLIYLILSLGAIGIGAVAFLLGHVANQASLGVFVALAFLIAVPAFLYIMIRWALVIPIMVVEHRYGLRAIRRSSELVTGVWWRTFGIGLVAALVVRVPLSVLQLFWSSVPVLGFILSGLVASVGSAYTAIAMIVYYFDRRCRLEDFDLRRLAEQIRTESVQGSATTIGAPSVG
ncbi:MAG TPA: hypothetical protein VEC38_08035 [Candidatus Binataceae bacterium]|nr:hypothetical protein [Candidatus Binataceae bacterium]